jgi:hypothetical protein
VRPGGRCALSTVKGQELTGKGGGGAERLGLRRLVSALGGARLAECGPEASGVPSSAPPCSAPHTKGRNMRPRKRRNGTPPHSQFGAPLRGPLDSSAGRTSESPIRHHRQVRQMTPDPTRRIPPPSEAIGKNNRPKIENYLDPASEIRQNHSGSRLNQTHRNHEFVGCIALGMMGR